MASTDSKVEYYPKQIFMLLANALSAIEMQYSAFCVKKKSFSKLAIDNVNRANREHITRMEIEEIRGNKSVIDEDVKNKMTEIKNEITQNQESCACSEQDNILSHDNVVKKLDEIKKKKTISKSKEYLQVYAEESQSLIPAPNDYIREAIDEAANKIIWLKGNMLLTSSKAFKYCDQSTSIQTQRTAEIMKYREASENTNKDADRKSKKRTGKKGDEKEENGQESSDPSTPYNASQKVLENLVREREYYKTMERISAYQVALLTSYEHMAQAVLDTYNKFEEFDLQDVVAKAGTKKRKRGKKR